MAKLQAASIGRLVWYKLFESATVDGHEDSYLIHQLTINQVPVCDVHESL
jgi:hypothetical protein